MDCWLTFFSLPFKKPNNESFQDNVAVAMEQKFTEFRESERSMKQDVKVLFVTCAFWHWGRMMVSCTRDNRFKYNNPFLKKIDGFCPLFKRIQ